MKINRQAVYDKYFGHCAYCGKIITIKEMQVDHIIPKARYHWINKDNLNTIENLNPSCRRCNHYKRSYSLEGYRKLLITLTERLQKIYIYKVATDYKVVQKMIWDKKFYFEKVNLETGDKNEMEI